MRKLGALCVVAGLLTQVGSAQEVRPAADTKQIIVDPKTVGGSKAIDRLVKEFGAKVVKDVGPGDAKVISLPADKATELVRQIEPSVADYQLLKGNYTAFLQPPPTIELSKEQKAKVEKLSRIGPTYIVAAPPRNFSRYVLSEGLGRIDGLQDERSLVMNFSNENLTAINGRHVREADGTIRWSAKLKYHPGLVTLVEDATGLSGVIRKGSDVFIVRPLADEFGKRLQAITKIERRKNPPTHDPNDPPIPIGKQSRLNDDASVRRQAQEPIKISVLFVYTDKSRAVLHEGTWDTPKTYMHKLLFDINDMTRDSGARVEYRPAGCPTGLIPDTLDCGFMISDYDERELSSFSDFLNKLSANNDFLSNIHAKRRETTADIIAVIVATDRGCGSSRKIGASRETAMIVVSANWECFANQTFAHEIGHLHGLVHDNFTGVPPYAYGYGYRRDPTWRSVMAYPCREESREVPCTIIGWANPRVICSWFPCEGERLGTPERNDEVRVLEESAPDIAKFY